MHNMIQLELTVEDVNIILAALGKGPYEQVHGLINNIIKQGSVQIEQNNESQTSQESD